MIQQAFIYSPYQINGDSHITVHLKYGLAITYGCCGITQPRYKTISDDMQMSIQLVN